MRIRVLTAVLLAIATLISYSASAATLQYSVNATVRALNDDNGAFSFSSESLDLLATVGIFDGADLSITLDIDSAFFPILTTSSVVNMSNAFSITSFSIGDVTIAQNSDTVMSVAAGFSANHFVNFGFISAAASPLGAAFVDIQFEDSTQSAIGTTFHPDDLDPLNFSPFIPVSEATSLGVAYTGVLMLLAVGNSQGFIQAEINSFERVVPIPGAVWLLLSSLFALAYLGKR